MLTPSLADRPTFQYRPRTAYGEALDACFQAYAELHDFARAAYKTTDGHVSELTSPDGTVTITFTRKRFIKAQPASVRHDGIEHQIGNPTAVEKTCERPYDVANSLREMENSLKTWATDMGIEYEYDLNGHALNILNDVSNIDTVSLDEIKRVVGNSKVATAGALRIYLDYEELPEQTTPLLEAKRASVAGPYLVAEGKEATGVVSRVPNNAGFWIDAVEKGTLSMRNIGTTTVQNALGLSGRFSSSDTPDEVFRQRTERGGFISTYKDGVIVRLADDIVARTTRNYDNFIEDYRSAHVEEETVKRQAGIANDIIEERSLDGLVKADGSGEKVTFSFNIPTKRVKKSRSRRNNYGSNYKTVNDYELFVEVLYDELDLGDSSQITEADISNEEHSKKLSSILTDQLRAQMRGRLEAMDERPVDEVYNELEAELADEASEQVFETAEASVRINNAIVEQEGESTITVLAPDPTPVRVKGPVIGAREFTLPAGVHVFGERGSLTPSE